MPRARTTFFLAGALACLALSGRAGEAKVEVVSSGRQGMEIEVSFDRPDIEAVQFDGRQAHRVSISGCHSTVEPGKPALPQKSFLIAVPPNHEVEARLVSSEEQKIPGIWPLPAPRPTDGSAGATLDFKCYQGPGEYPQGRVSVSEPSFIGDRKVATITLFPASFQASSGTLVWRRRMRLTINFLPRPYGDRIVGPEARERYQVLDRAVDRMLLNRSTAGDWLCRPAPVKSIRLRSATDTLAYKILVDRDGMYRISYGDLAAAGISPGAFDPRTLRLYHRGQQVAVYFPGQEDGIFDPGDYFEFWGRRARGDSSYHHFYTDAEVYYLSWGGPLGARMVEEEDMPVGPGIVPAQSFIDTLHLEQDLSFVRLKRRESDQTDRWFWRQIDKDDSLALDVDLAGLKLDASQPVKLSIRVHGYTYIDDNPEPDHGLAASINGQELPPAYFDGQSPYTYYQEIPAWQLHPGANRLVIKHAPVVHAIDAFLLNWIEVCYPRGYQAQDDRLVFRRPDGLGDTLVQFTVGGFSTHIIDLYKPGVSKITGATIQPGPSGLDYQLVFNDRTYGQVDYVAVAGDTLGKLRPRTIVPNQASDLTNAGNLGQYLIVAPDTLRSQALALAAQRASQFSSAMVALTSDIYDEFGFGLASDRALKDFLQYAYDNWQTPPGYILFMGEGSWDPKNLTGRSKPDLVPVHFTRTDDFGPVADENYYACLSGDDLLPDVCLGRLAVSDPAHYAGWEAKRNSYEQHPLIDQWRRDFMLVAGWPLNSGDDFYTPSNTLASSLDPRFTVSKVYHGREGGNTQNLLEQFNEGSAVGAYYGHGGGQVWSHSTFLTVHDVPRLNNWGRWPFLTAATCYTNSFDTPDTTCLGQEFLRAQGGAIGILASSGPSWGNIIEWTTFEAIDQADLRLLGEIALYAKVQLSGGLPPGGYIAEMMTSFNLLGDPGTRLSLADKSLTATINPASISPGDSIILYLDGEFPVSSIGLFSLADSTDTTRLQRAFSITQPASAVARLAGDDSLAPGNYRGRIYLKAGASDWAAATELGVGRPAFSGYVVDPANPTDLTSIGISALAFSPSGIESVWCRYKFGARNDTLGWASRPMAVAGGDTFSLVERIMAGSYQPYLNFRLSLADTAGQVWSGQPQLCRILKRPDLIPAPDEQALRLEGRRQLALQARIKNQGELTAHQVPVSFFYAGNDSQVGAAIIDSIPAGVSAAVSIPWPDGGTRQLMCFRIDPLHTSWPLELDTSNNNSGLFQIPAEPFLYRQLGGTGGSGDTVALPDGSFRWFLPDSILEDSAVAYYGAVSINQWSPYYHQRQPGLTPAGNVVPYQGYIVGFTDSTLAAKPGRELWLGIDGHPHAEPGITGIYRFDPANSMYLLIPGTYQEPWLMGPSSKPGLFALFNKSDTTGPTISARIDRRATGWGNYIRTTSQLYHILAEDPDGVDPSSVRIWQDGVEMPASAYSIDLSPADPRSVPVLFPANLGEGHHTLEFEAADLLGNRSAIRDELDVLVSFGLYEIANYPNPVDGDLTTFYFLVGDHADRWRTDIYTIAGRHLRTLEGGYASGVHTFDWDLTDREGRRVANGVYFYVMTVWSGERAEKRTGKMAVLR